MNDLIATAATIQGAQIQANYTLWASIISALFLVATVYFTAKNTVKQIKLEKVAESKRDQYIALTDAYTKFLVSSLLLPRIDELDNSEHSETYNSWNQHLAKYIELLGSINKVNLITTSEIRLALFELDKELRAYQTSVSNYYFNNKSKDLSHNLEEKVFEFAKLLREDLGIENDSAMESNLLELRNKS